MTERRFKLATILLAVLFTAYFGAVVMPPLVESPDVVGAFAAGF